MGYANVGTPRFWVDWNLYNNAMGVITGHSDFRAHSDGAGLYSSIYNLNPTNERYLSPTSTTVIANDTWGAHSLYNGWILNPEEINWIGLLGHNLGNTGTGFGATFGGDFNGDGNDNNYPKAWDYTPIVNGGTPSTTDSKLYPELDGFTIAEIGGFSSTIVTETVRKLHLEFTNSAATTSMVQKFGAFCLGKYYDMQQPDLSLKLSYEMDGVKNIQTLGGSTISNAMYTKPADWGSRGAWQLGDNQNYRNGRRSWDLSFSFLKDSDIMPENGITANGSYDTNILTGTDFYSQVINRTMGAGNLPFIFQPDNTNNKADAFAIARFDMNSFQLTQVGINLYNCSLKIRESW